MARCVCVLPSWLRSGYLWRVEWCLCQGPQSNCGRNWKGVFSNASAEQVSPCLDNAICQRHCKDLWLWWITLDPTCQQEVKGTTSHCQYSAHWLASSSRACGAQQHGLAPEVRPIPAVPVPPTPVPAQVAVPVTPGNGQQGMYEVQSPQTPVPMRRRRRMPPNPPLALTFEAAAPGTPNPVAIGIPAVPGTPLVSAAAMPAPAASTPANAAGPVASAQDSIAPAASGQDAGASGPDAGASGCFSSCPRGHWGFKCCRATSSQCSSARWESRSGKWTSSFVCHSIVAAKMAKHLKHFLVDILSTQIAWESGVEWPRLGIFTSAHCIPSLGLSLPNLQLQMTGSLIPVSDWWRRCSSSFGSCSRLGPWAFVKALWFVREH